ncbi:MAG: BtrH N-terminal domain-containing protein [Chloroflexi bacterium]|nr:BtrH N-terminal domain-containing protein [Chloroflexota bacterium]
MIIDNYTQLGGYHPETAAMTNILANSGVVAPHTGRPFTEAMILGIGGGLGATYILWEFKKHKSAVIVLAFRNKSNYVVEYMQNTCDRLGATAVIHETGGVKTATKQLNNALAAGKPAITWLDQQQLPYLGMRDIYNGCFGYLINTIGYDQATNEYLLDDKSSKPMRIDADTLSSARARIGSSKNRLFLINAPTAPINLEQAIQSGIADCVDYLSSTSQSFSLPVLKKWARMMTDTKNKKGWPTVFKQGTGLYSTLRSIYEGIRWTTTEGEALRGMYTNFLTEANQVTPHPALADAAAHYKELAELWAAFAKATMPDSLPAMQETKQLLSEKYTIWRELGHEGMPQIQTLNEQLIALEMELNPGVPITPEVAADLFTDLQDRLYELFDKEKTALKTLSAFVR